MNGPMDILAQDQINKPMKIGKDIFQDHTNYSMCSCVALSFDELLVHWLE